MRRRSTSANEASAIDVYSMLQPATFTTGELSRPTCWREYLAGPDILMQCLIWAAVGSRLVLLLGPKCRSCGKTSNVLARKACFVLAIFTTYP